MAKKKGNSLRLEMMVMLSTILAIFGMTGIIFPAIISSSTLPLFAILVLVFVMLAFIGILVTIVAKIFRKRWKL
jgi:hypothetical protein